MAVARLDVNVPPGIGAPRWTWLGIGQDALDAALHASSSAKGKGKDKDTSARAALSAVCEGSGEELLIRHVPDAHQYALRVPAGSHCVRISRAAHAETMLDRIVQEEPTRDGRGFIVHNGVLAVQFGNDSGLEAVFLPGDWEDNSLQPNQRKRYVSDISGEIHVAMQKEVADFQGSCRSGSAAVIQTKQWRVSGIQTSHETECTTVIITREAPSNVAPFLAHIVLQEHVVIPMAGTALQYKICVRNEAPSRAPTSVFALTAYGFVRPERQLFGKTKQHWVLDVERPNGTRCALVKDKVPIKYSEGRGQMLLHGEDEYKCPALGVCSLRFHCGPQHRNFYTTEMERWHLINNALRMSLVDLMSGSLPTVIRTGGESSIFGFWVACYSAGVDAFHTHQHAFLTSLRRPALPLSAAPLLWTFPSPQAAWINQAQVLQAIWTRSITNAHCLMLPCNDDARIVRIDDELSIYGRSGASLHVPLSCNFQRSPELRLNFSKAPGVSAGLFISKIGSDPGSRICLAEFSGNDSTSDDVIEICLSTKTGWYAGGDTRKPFPKKNGTKEMRQVHANHAFALTFRADASASLESECELATIHQLVVGPPKLDAPRLVTPVNDANVTDVAVSYEIQNQTAVGHFVIRVQVFKDSSLTFTPEDVVYQLANRRSCRANSYHSFFPENWLLVPGSYVWRARIEEPLEGFESQWSSLGRFDVNNDHAFQPLSIRIGPDAPMLSWEVLRNFSALEKLFDAFPERLRSRVAFRIGDVDRTTFGMIVQLSARRSIPVFFKMTTASLARMEWAFQTSPFVLGFSTGELMYGFHFGTPKQPTVWSEAAARCFRAIKLCGKYGRRYVMADGQDIWHKWTLFGWESPEEFQRLLQTHADYIVLGHKTNISNLGPTSMSAVMGLWLSGRCSQILMWNEPWYWEHAGFKGLGEPNFGLRKGSCSHMPPIFWIQVFLLGVAQGCTLLCYDGQICAKGNLRDSYKDTETVPGPALYSDDCFLLPAFKRFLEPFFNALLDRQMIPSREEILQESHVLVVDAPHFRHAGQWGEQYSALFCDELGFSPSGKAHCELFPRNGQFFPIATVGRNCGTLDCIPEAIARVSLEDPDAPRSLHRELTTRYVRRYSEDTTALVLTLGPRFFVMTTEENANVSQKFELTLASGRAALHGCIGPHTYIMGRQDGNQLWLQANTQYFMSYTMSLRLVLEDSIFLDSSMLDIHLGNVLASVTGGSSSADFDLDFKSSCCEFLVHLPIEV